MIKIGGIFKKKNLILQCFFLMFLGWEMHVFKLWTMDVYNKAKLCEETNCIKIANMAIELQDYSLPVGDYPKNNKTKK